MTKTNTPKFQWFRWYDKHPNLRAIVKLTEELPSPMQEKVATQLLKIARSYWDRVYHRTELTEQDLAQLPNLYKSQKRSRWYDDVPDMLEALNLIMLLTETQRQQLDRECSNLVGYVCLQVERHRGSVPVKGKVTLPILNKVAE